MKLLVVSNGYPPRGALGTEFYTRELVRGLASRGHAVTVLHPDRGGGRERYELEPLVEEGIGITLLHNPPDARKRFARSYRDERVEQVFGGLLERERPELVHFTYLLWGLSVGLPEVARARGIPSVATLTDYGLLCHRGQMFDWKLARCFGPHPPPVCARCIREPAPFDHPRPSRLARLVAARALAPLGGLGRVVVERDVEERERAVRSALGVLERLIAPTRSLLEVFARSGVPREKLVQLGYAFDETPYRAACESPAPRRTRLGFFGQFAPHKGFGTLLAAARELERLAGAEAWELALHGAPSAGRHRLYAPRMLARFASPRVRMEGSFAPEEAPRILSGLSALVVPSEWDENAPLSVLQARAAGLPVIASDVPGIAEILTDGVHGRLVPPGDPRALAAALHQVVRGGFARPLAPGAPLSFAEHLERLEALYAAVLGGGSGT